MVDRILVGAHYGLKDWVVQRISAIVMAVYTVYFVMRAIVVQPTSFDRWQAFFNPFTCFMTFLAVVAMCWHAWIGMRDILMDYVKSTALRLFLEAFVAICLIGYMGWAIKVLIKVV